MSLRKVVFLTKRVIVLLVFLVFICGALRLFLVLSERFSVKQEFVGLEKPEAGFGKLPLVKINSRYDSSFLKISRFRISTTSGLLDTENGYPIESTVNPLVNVFSVQERPIDITNTEDPIKIAQSMKFSTKPNEISSTQKEWYENNRRLIINGQYKTVFYKNENLIEATPQNSGQDNPNQLINSSDYLKNFFQNAMRYFKIPTSFDEYKFSLSYLDYDPDRKDFNVSTSSQGRFIRIDAKRVYPSLNKTKTPNQDDAVPTNAAYYDFFESINYLIIRNDPKMRSQESLIDYLVEMSIYNWPINTTITGTNVSVQTYPIITPKQAYKELTNGNAYLVSARKYYTNEKVDLTELFGVDVADILALRLEYYEDVEFNKYIQPVYVFITEVMKNERKYQLVYYVPAIDKEYILE